MIGSHRRKTRRGATLVEMSIVLMLAMTVIMAILEYGRYIMVRQLVDNAARSGARMAAVSTNNQNLSPVTSLVNQQLAGQVSNHTTDVYWCDGSTGASKGTWYLAPYGEGIAVKVTTSYTPMVPTFGILPSPMTITSTSIMRSEAN